MEQMRQVASVMVGDHAIGDGHPTYVIAEMACAHEGKPDLAHYGCTHVPYFVTASVNRLESLFRS